MIAGRVVGERRASPAPMSALGQKQTYAVQNAVSDLDPIATAKADMRKWSCPLYPRKRTCAVQLKMSALGQKRTLARPANYLDAALLTLSALNIGPRPTSMAGSRTIWPAMHFDLPRNMFIPCMVNLLFC